MKGYDLSNLGTVKKLCDKYGFMPGKRFGQNFIVNSGLCPKIVERAGVTENDGVLEIGTGIGTLTVELAKVAKKVVTLEVDERLRPVLEETISDYENVELVYADVLKTDIKSLLKEHFDGMNVKVVANLPYYITSPVIMELLCGKYGFESITVMVQKEAAQRLCAEVGKRDCGAVSVAVSYYSDARPLFNVSAGSFMPPPNVESTVIELLPKDEPDYKPQDEKLFFRLVKAGFGQRRKTLPNALSAGANLSKEEAIKAVTQAVGDAKIRAEKLTMQDWQKLSDEVLLTINN